MTKKNNKDHRLTPDVKRSLLYGGLFGDDHIFKNDQDRRKAWEEFKDLIMAMKRNPCMRPDAWWTYESLERPWYAESNRQALARLDLLTSEEIAYLKETNQWPVEPCPGPDYDPRDVLNS
jgi:hypothetical protein